MELNYHEYKAEQAEEYKKACDAFSNPLGLKLKDIVNLLKVLNVSDVELFIKCINYKIEVIHSHSFFKDNFKKENISLKKIEGGEHMKIEYSQKNRDVLIFLSNNVFHDVELINHFNLLTDTLHWQEKLAMIVDMDYSRQTLTFYITEKGLKSLFKDNIYIESLEDFGIIKFARLNPDCTPQEIERLFNEEVEKEKERKKKMRIKYFE